MRSALGGSWETCRDARDNVLKDLCMPKPLLDSSDPLFVAALLTIMLLSGNLSRDKEFYFEDGTCVIRVQRCLFNLHRTILRKHSGFFRLLLSRSRDSEGLVEGEKDDHPIVCDDSAEAFRSFCWALYASFQELEEQNGKNHLTERNLAQIGSLAHKYECDVIERWAERSLDRELQTIIRERGLREHMLSLSFLGGSQSFRNLPSTTTLGELLQSARVCNWPHVRENVEILLLDTIQGTWARLGASETATDLRVVLDIAETVKDKELKARAYFTFLRSIKWCPSPRERSDYFGGTTFSFESAILGSNKWDSLSSLTDAQKVCLYRGYLAFSSLRSAMRKMPAVSAACECIEQMGVGKRWEHCARSLSGDIENDDPQLFLERMQSRLDLKSVSTTVTHEGKCGIDCLSEGINQLLKDLESNLVAFFPVSEGGD